MIHKSKICTARTFPCFTHLQTCPTMQLSFQLVSGHASCHSPMELIDDIFSIWSLQRWKESEMRCLLTFHPRREILDALWQLHWASEVSDAYQKHCLQSRYTRNTNTYRQWGCTGWGHTTRARIHQSSKGHCPGKHAAETQDCAEPNRCRAKDVEFKIVEDPTEAAAVTAWCRFLQDVDCFGLWDADAAGKSFSLDDQPGQGIEESDLEEDELLAEAMQNACELATENFKLHLKLKTDMWSQALTNLILTILLVGKMVPGQGRTMNGTHMIQKWWVSSLSEGHNTSEPEFH